MPFIHRAKAWRNRADESAQICSVYDEVFLTRSREAITDHLQTLTSEWMDAYAKRLRSILIGVQCIQVGEKPALTAERLNDL